MSFELREAAPNLPTSIPERTSERARRTAKGKVEGQVAHKDKVYLVSESIPCK